MSLIAEVLASTPPWVTVLQVAGLVFVAGAVLGYLWRTKGDGGVALGIAVAIHVALFWWMGRPRERPPASTKTRVEFEVAELPPEPQVEPEPEPEPEPQPEPEAEPEPKPEPKPKPKPKRAPKQKPKREAPPKAEPAPQPKPAKPLRFDLSQTGGSSGVAVPVGTPSNGTSTRSDAGKARKPKSTGDGGGGEADTGGSGGKAKKDGWSPTPKTSISTLPMPQSVPKIHCPASKTEGIEGTVVLKVQVRANGKVRRVTVKSGIGHGCDAVAKKALAKAKFQPAKATNGSAADTEITYEYVFSL